MGSIAARDDLESLMKKNNWNRSQMRRHLGLWNRLGGHASKNLGRSRDDVIQSLRENCLSAEELLRRTWASRDIVALNPHVTIAEGSRKKMEDVSLWSHFMDDIFEKVADNRATSGIRMPQMSAQRGLATEALMQELWKTFNGAAGSSSLRSFFYVFTSVFVALLFQSYVEPDLDEIEDEVIKSIVSERDVSRIHCWCS